MFPDSTQCLPDTIFPRATIIDIGRRHLPKRCIHYFEDVTWIIFCVSLGDYDQVVRQDDGQVRHLVFFS